MKRVLKTVCILALVLTVLLAMTACGDAAGEQSAFEASVAELFEQVANWFNELWKAIVRSWEALVDWFRQLFGIKPDCEHTYDNACDATCNDCGETREVGGHDFADADCTTPKTCKTCGATEGSALGHTWIEADCENAKTCSVCEVTDGNALGHTPAEDDGDCSTEVKCTVCGDVTTPAGQHTPNADDGDCTTAITCSD